MLIVLEFLFCFAISNKMCWLLIENTWWISTSCWVYTRVLCIHNCGTKINTLLIMSFIKKES